MRWYTLLVGFDHRIFRASAPNFNLHLPSLFWSRFHRWGPGILVGAPNALVHASRWLRPLPKSGPFRVSHCCAGVCRAVRAGVRKGGRVGVRPRRRAGWTEGALGPVGPSRYAAFARVPCLPASIDVCLAVWEQFWCDRAGLFCGSWAFQRVRRRRVRRGPPRGKTYAYPEGHPQRCGRGSA